MIANKLLRSSLPLVAAGIISGCAGNSFKEKTIRNMVAASLVGAAIGQNEPDSKAGWSMVYAGAGASLAALGSVLWLEPNEDAKRENEVLKAKLDEFERLTKPKLVSSGGSLFKTPPPKELQGIVELGEWKRYKLDQWVQDPNQPNTWYRQVEMFEVIPPGVNQ
ncbi:MAG TPA: hypothetical protein PLU50_04855 [Pseudobdellovibrionaceae bacterium]|nr:hypothetical protein [Pseudobdellovibrionaceae bacterium]